MTDDEMTVVVQRVKMQSFADSEALPFDEMRQTLATMTVPSDRDIQQVVQDACAQANTQFNDRWDYEVHKIEQTVALSDLD